MAGFPRVATVDLKFPRPVADLVSERVRVSVRNVLAKGPSIKNRRIAVAVGSRGISSLQEVVAAVISALKEAGAKPFVVPAMGSHGGATPEGQRAVLATYGITSESIDAPIESDLETVQIGKTVHGVPVRIDCIACESDGIVLINRVKAHTDFTGAVESGLLKMIAVGLGNAEGAGDFHSWTGSYSHDLLIESKARVLLDTGKVLLGLALIENAYHELASVEAIPGAEIPVREKALLKESKKLMPALPIDQLDLLILDRLGKNISGTGMDPNITGRRFKLGSVWQEKTPDVTRIAVLDLTDESHGNAIGIGLADFCNTRIIEKMDRRVTYFNVITSTNTAVARLPLWFDSDLEVVEQAIQSLGNRVNVERLRMMRILDTLSLARIETSESLLPELERDPRVDRIGELRPMEFSSEGRLPPLQMETHPDSKR